MTRNAVLACLVLVVAASLACHTDGVAGKYTSETQGRSFIELKPDGSFVARDGETTVAGRYAVQSTQITFTTDSGFTSRGTLVAGSIDRDGERFTRR